MATTRHKILRASILCAILPVVVFAGWVGWRYLETRDEEAACGCPEDPMDGELFGLWSPFRNNESEKVAAEVLQAFQSGNCERIPAASEYCERERRFKVVSWKATGRSSDGRSVSMRYWVTRAESNGANFGDPVWITVQRQGKTWKVESVSLYY
jgi:hypothetical protein